LSATAIDPDGTVAKVEFLNGATKLGEDSDAPFTFAWSGVPAGEYTVTARAVDNLGDATLSESVTFAVQHDTVLPVQWAKRDIGTAASPGSTEYSDEVYTLSSAGTGYSTTDQFHFLTQPWIGDGEIVARVVSVDPANSGAIAGVMVRENRSATARHALLAVKPGSAAAFQWRAQPAVQVRQRPVASGAPPQWLRLVRHGARCTAYVSIDGTQWEQAWSVALLLPEKVFVGLTVAAGRAVFDQVTVRSLPAAPQSPVVRIANPADGASFVAPASITLDVSATDPDGGIARVDLFRNGTKIVSDAKAPFSFIWTGATPGTHTLTSRAVDFTGLKTTSSPITISVQPGPTTLPAPWASRDIGIAPAPGSVDFADGSYTLTGSGDDLLYTTDQAHFVWQSWTGDGTLISRVASIAPTHATSLGGLVFRENFAANGRYVAATLTKGQGALLQYRSEPAADSVSGSARAVAAPQWLRISRRGDRFSGAVSVDGITWQSLGSQTIVMSQTCKVGLIVCAGSGGESTTVVFDSVSLTLP
jgi:regulation of enolase protein 1 (concanavalin A-like superfamily)